jgi:hypothetical protein
MYNDDVSANEPQYTRREDDRTFMRVEEKVDTILEALNGNEEKDIEGIRPRLRAVETEVKKMVRLVEDQNLPGRVVTLEVLAHEIEKRDLLATVVSLQSRLTVLEEERKTLKTWIKGLVAGMAVATITSGSAFILQVIKWLNGVP